MKLLKKGLSHQEVCKYRNLIAMKVIRLRDISDLAKIMHIKTANVRIINLLRHPFPMMLSRRTGLQYFMWNQRTRLEWERNNIAAQRIKAAWEAYNYCSETRRSIDFIESDPWWRDRYLKVTHREMSLSPLKTAKIIYDFIGEPLTVEIREHVENMTSGKRPKKIHVKNFDPLEVYRNSSMIANRWTEFPSDLLSYWDLYSVEAQCRLILKPIEEKFQLDSISLAKRLDIHEGNLN